MTRETIDSIRERMCDEYCILPQVIRVKSCNACPLNELEASAEPDDWLDKNKDLILQAGMEGREVEFYIDGRLFAIREKAQ